MAFDKLIQVLTEGRTIDVSAKVNYTSKHSNGCKWRQIDVHLDSELFAVEQGQYEDV